MSMRSAASCCQPLHERLGPRGARMGSEGGVPRSGLGGASVTVRFMRRSSFGGPDGRATLELRNARGERGAVLFDPAVERGQILVLAAILVERRHAIPDPAMERL